MTTLTDRLVMCISIVFMTLVGVAQATRPLAQGDVIEGTLTYRERIALPPEAVAEVSLLDTSRADAAAIVIAKMNVLPEGLQVPLPFTLRYDPGRIVPTHTYTVRAIIRIGRQMMFTTDTAYPVITQGHPNRVELTLVSVAGGASSSVLQGTRWLLEDLNGRGVLDRVQATLEFTDRGRIAGNASCNRFFGTAEVGDGSISFGPLGATRMSCTEAIMKQETRYLKALEKAERFKIDDPYLLIFYQGASQPLRFIQLDFTRSLPLKHDKLAFRTAGMEPF